MSETMPRKGDAVPAFELELDDGRRVSDRSLRGRPYVLYFYPKDDTPGCTKEAIAFSELADAFAELGVEIIGVSRDDLESHRSFRRKYGLKVRLASDPAGEVTRSFGAWGEKKRYGKVSVGVIRSTFLVGPEGRILRAWRNVRVPGHAERVLQEARRLLAPSDRGAA